MKKYAIIEVSSWYGISLDTEHYYGKIKYYDENEEYQSCELSHKLTPEEAIRLTEKDELYKYRAGDESSRFEDEKDIIKIGIEKLLSLVPDLELIFEGFWGNADVQKCVWAKDKNLKKEINALYERAEKIDFWEKPEHENEMKFISESFNLLME